MFPLATRKFIRNKSPVKLTWTVFKPPGSFQTVPKAQLNSKKAINITVELFCYCFS